MRELTPKQRAVLDYLEEPGRGFVSPSEIGINVGGRSYYSSSSWACSAFKALEKRGLVVDNGRTHLKQYKAAAERKE